MYSSTPQSVRGRETFAYSGALIFEISTYHVPFVPPFVSLSAVTQPSGSSPRFAETALSMT